MKKFTVLGLAAMLALLPSLPALAACGERAADGNSPQISLPAEELLPSEPPLKELPAPIPQEEQRPAEAWHIVVQVSGLHVRSGAGTDSPSLGQADKGTLLRFDGEKNGWYQTYYRNRPAYVSAAERYTAVGALERGDERTEAVVAEGMNLLGTPYVYGATRFHDGNGQRLRGFTTDAFDCSSLIQYIFFRGAGVLLDVTTRTQVRQGVHVEKDGLRRGDLMFFTNASRQNKTGLERVGHVALYLGENYILHTASDFAKVEQISAQRWAYFLEARRVL